jgi:hypothetical protein
VILVETLTRLLLFYTACGLGFGLAFVGWAVGRIDPAARGAPLGFRVIILPGVVALWPVLAVQWFRALSKGGK